MYQPNNVTYGVVTLECQGPGYHLGLPSQPNIKCNTLYVYVGRGDLKKLSLYNHVPVVALPTDWISMSLRI